MLVQDKPLSNIQLELLRLYGNGIPDQQLLEVREMLIDYFFNKATEEVDRIWDEKGWTNETMNEWLKGEDHD